MRTSKQNQRRKLAVVGLSIGAIFVCDWLTPRGYVVWILYLIPVLLAARLADRRFLPVVAAVCVVLVMAGLFVSSPGIALPVAIFNRLVGVAVLWVAALLLGQRKRAEAALREREEQLRALIEHAPAAIAMFDREMKYVAASRRYLWDYELGEQNLIGRSHYEVFPEIPERWKAIHRRCLAGAMEKCDEDPFPRADGRLDWVRWEIHPWHESTGEIGGILLFSEVITARKQTEAVVRETQRRLTSLIANLPGVVYRCRNDRNWTIEFVSEGVLQHLGYPAADFLEHRREIGQLIHPDDRGRVWEEIQTALRERRRYELTYRITTASGEEKWLWEQGAGVFDASGTLQALEGFATDITARKQAEAALRESEARLRLSVQASNIGLWDWDLQTNAVYFSPEWKRQIGYRDDEISNRFDEWQSRVHPDDLQPTLQKVRAFLNEPKGRHEVEFRFRHKDGSYRWIYARADVQRDAAGKPARMLGCHIDITERKQSEEALRALTQRLQTVREEERTGIARELHDQLGQALTGLKIDVSWMDRRLAKAHDGEIIAALREKTVVMTQQIDETIKTVRRLSSQLRPGILDDLGLVAALDWQAQEFQNRTGIECRVSLPEESPPLSGERATAMFRIFQEALTNVTRHAQASRATVTLEQQGGVVILEIADNGQGIEPDRIGSAGSLGLLGMRERAAAVGGTVEVAGPPGKGTRVVVRVPVARQECR